MRKYKVYRLYESGREIGPTTLMTNQTMEDLQKETEQVLSDPRWSSHEDPLVERRFEEVVEEDWPGSDS